jgi:hypothetical protein
MGRTLYSPQAVFSPFTPHLSQPLIPQTRTDIRSYRVYAAGFAVNELDQAGCSATAWTGSDL